MLAAPDATQSTRASQDRDLRIDFFRGLALLMIFVNHVPGNALSALTLRQFALADAAEMFVLIAGYASVLAYGRIAETRGLAGAARAVLGRIRDLFAAHLLLVTLGAAGIAIAAWHFENPLYFEQVNLTPFSYDPFGAIWKTIVLYHQIDFLNILPLYVVLLAWLVALLAMLRVHWGLALGASVGLWLMVQVVGVNFPAYPSNYGWFFNPIAWQLLFTIGVLAAHAGRRGVALPVNRWLIVAAAAYALLCMLMLAPWRSLPGLAGLRVIPGDSLGLFWKTNLPIQRLASILALAYLVVALIRADARWLRSAWATHIVNCGRNALEIFSLGTLLSLAGFVVLLEGGRAWYLQTIVNAVGLGVLVAVGWLLTARKMRARRLPAAEAVPG